MYRRLRFASIIPVLLATPVMHEQIQDHSDDLRKFSDEIKTTQDPDVRRFAAETLPILQQHLALAKAVDASLSGDEAQETNGSK